MLMTTMMMTIKMQWNVKLAPSQRAS